MKALPGQQFLLRRRRSCRVALVCLFATLSAGALSAATVEWTGLGADDLWSDATNWLGGVSPVDGDSVVFYQNTPREARTSRFNYTLSLNSFTFDDGADPNAITIGAGPGGSGAPVTLTLTGIGLVNDPDATGSISSRQQFSVDGGRADNAAGSSLIFANTSSTTGNQAIDLTASGAAVNGASGGNIIFQDHSSTAVTFNNYNALYATGGTVAGAGGGNIILRDDAISQFTASFYVSSGAVAGASGGQLLVQDNASITGNINLFGGIGLEATAAFSGHSTLTGGLYIGEGTAGIVGNAALATFSGNAALEGSAFVYASTTAASGGRLEFHDNATLYGNNPTPGYAATILNDGSAVAGAPGGKTDFYDNSAVTGFQEYINNETANEDPAPGSLGGTTTFHNHSLAGEAVIGNYGANVSGAGTTGGSTTFLDSSDAQNANISAYGGQVAGAPGGQVVFAGNSTANQQPSPRPAAPTAGTAA